MDTTHTAQTRIAQLADMLDVYSSRHKIPQPVLERVDNARRNIERGRNHIRHLEDRIAELNRELRIVEQEADGRERLLEAVLEQTLRELGIEVDAHWSPTPILAFRAWRLEDNALVGIHTAWDSPSLSAICATTGERIGVPHSDRRCGVPGCGIYALKSVETLFSTYRLRFDPTHAVGLVALEGKVVEHELGYRAQNATAVAVAATTYTNQITTADEDMLRELFADPMRTIARHGEPYDPAEAATVSIEFLTNEQARRSPWT